jgi:nucleoside-diphosphate-sugar epimerase
VFDDEATQVTAEPGRPVASLMAKTVAVTGATGFVGRQVVERLRRDGLHLRALSRRGAIARVTTIAGDLADPAALQSLVDGADEVVHLAGLVKSPDPAEFARVNVQGAETLVRAMAPGKARLLLVSSLAARHRGVSAYAASKRAAEDVALRLLGPERVRIIRPPAVYGPGDRATLPIFQQLARGLLIAPGPRGARFSLIHVSDLAELISGGLTGELEPPPLLEPDDGQPGGYGWGDLAAIASRTTGRRVRTIRLPTRLLRQPARLADLLARRFAFDLPLTEDKLGELGYGQWVAGGPPLPAALPRITFEEGFRSTLDWYKEAGWL